MTAPSDAASRPLPAFRAASSEEILAVVPHLLGFVPQRSFVIIGAERLRGTVEITFRYDLSGPGDDHAADIAQHALMVLAWRKLDCPVAVGYGPGALVTPVVTAFRALAGDGGLGPMEFLRVEDGRYWSYTWTKSSCSPAEGRPFDASVHPVPAGLASGSEVLASRDAVAASIAPLAGAAAESMLQTIRRSEQMHFTRALVADAPRARAAARKALVGQALVAVSDMIATYRDGGRYSADDLAWPVVALQDLRIRDDAWARLDPAYAKAHLRMLTDTVRHAPPGYVAAPALLLAFVAWQLGKGTLANVALDRTLADDPECTAADHLRQVINAGAPPALAGDVLMTPEEVTAYYDQTALSSSDNHCPSRRRRS